MVPEIRILSCQILVIAREHADPKRLVEASDRIMMTVFHVMLRARRRKGRSEPRRAPSEASSSGNAFAVRCTVVSTPSGRELGDGADECAR